MRIAFQFSIGPQSFEVAAISALNYGQVNPGTLAAQFPYDGRDLAAPWRAEAQARIEQDRKSNLNILVKTILGRPIPGATVKVETTRLNFKVGTAIDSPTLLGVGADNDRYRAAVEQLFNVVVFENHLKWLVCECCNQSVAPSISWLQARNILIQGYNIIWPNWETMPTDVQALGTTATRARVDAHFDNILNATRGKIYE